MLKFYSLKLVTSLFAPAKQIALVLFISAQASNLSAAQSITWMVYDWRPWQYFDSDEQQFKGYAIEWQNLISAELTGYQHRIRMMNDTRMLKQFQAGKQVWNFGAEPGGDVSQVAYLSNPVAATVDLVAFTRKDTFESLAKPSELSIEQLLDRSVGFPMDPANFPWLSHYSEHPNLQHIKSSNPSQSIFRMLAKGRIDFAIDYLVEGQAMQRNLGLEDQLTTLLLSETKAPWIGVIACSKTPWGKQVIKDINRILPKVVSATNYRAIYERYLDNTTLPYYRQAFQRGVIAPQTTKQE